MKGALMSHLPLTDLIYDLEEFPLGPSRQWRQAHRRTVTCLEIPVRDIHLPECQTRLGEDLHHLPIRLRERGSP